MTAGTSVSASHSVPLFVLFAPEDVSHYEQLANHLRPLVRERLITLHNAAQTLPGDERHAAMEKHLRTARLLLLLLSSDFVASNDCYESMQSALHRQEKGHVQVIAIYLRPVDCDALSLPNTLQVLPTNGRAVTSWSKPDEAYCQIARKIRAIVCPQLTPGSVHRGVTEDSLPYLHWLIKRVTSLDIAVIPALPGRPQIDLAEVYLPLQARFEERRQIRGLALGANVPEEEQVHSSPLIQVVARHDHLVLLGGPGSGKTTFLRYLARRHALALRDQAEAPEIGAACYPILLRLADYVAYGMREGTPLSRFLLEDCQRHEGPASALHDILSSALPAGKCIVLLDGLDEVVRADDRRVVVERLEDFVRCSDGVPNRFVITSRSAGYDGFPMSEMFAHYTLQALSHAQMHSLLTSSLALDSAHGAGTTDDTVTTLMKDIETTPGLSQLAANPWLLSIMARLHQAGVSLSRQRVELYTQITEMVVRTGRTPQAFSEISPLFDQPFLTSLLSRLAYWLHRKKPAGVAPESEIWKILGKERARLTGRPWREEDLEVEGEMRQFLRVVCEQTGILAEESHQCYRFAHLTFEEYYAARYLVASGRKRVERIRACLPDPHWQEPILLALGCIGMESPEEAHVLIRTAILAQGKQARALGLRPGPFEPLLGQDYLFALRCLGDNIPVDDALAQQLAERLLQELTEQGGRGRFRSYQDALGERLGAIETSVYAHLLLPFLFEYSKSAESGLRPPSLYSLGRIARGGAEQAQIREVLLEALYDRDPVVRSAALWGLSSLRGSDIPKILLGVLSNDTDLSVKHDAIHALGERGEASAQVMKALLGVLQEEPTTPGSGLLRYSAVKSLGQLGDTSPAVQEALIALSSRGLLLFSHEGVLQRLRQGSCEQDGAPHVRAAVAWRLQAGGHVSSDVLAYLRDDQPERAPARVFRVPYCVKQWYWLPERIEASLLYRMHNPRCRWEAVQALSQLDGLSERAVGALLMALHDEKNAYVRGQVVRTLSAYELSEETLAVFIDTCSSDRDAYVRARIVECFGDMKQTCDRVLRALFQVIQDTDEYVRVCAVRSLGRLTPDSSDLLSTLLRLLRHDPDAGVRWEVVMYLGTLEELPSKAIHALVRALTDEYLPVREDCAHLLGQARSGHKRTIPALLQGLSDPEVAVRRACSQALVQSGQRCHASKQIITKQLAWMIQKRWHDDRGYDVPCDVAYKALWLLVNNSAGA